MSDKLLTDTQTAMRERFEAMDRLADDVRNWSSAVNRHDIRGAQEGRNKVIESARTLIEVEGKLINLKTQLMEVKEDSPGGTG